MRLTEKEASKFEIGSSTLQRENGIYYTDLAIARVLVENSISLKDNFPETFFEPCVGGGAFLLSYLDYMVAKKGATYTSVQGILDNCYIADNNPSAIDNLLELIPVYCMRKYGVEARLSSKNTFIGDSLFEPNPLFPQIKDFQAHFELDSKFDFIVTNPPYRLLKTDKRLQINNEANHLSPVLDKEQLGIFELSQGTRNLYKLFTEAILTSWLKPAGVFALLVPRGILTDPTSEKLRSFILDNYRLGRIVNISEGTEYFKKVGQAFTSFCGVGSQKTEETIFGTLDEVNGQATYSEPVSMSFHRKFSKVNAVFEMNSDRMTLLEKLYDFPTISANPNILNLRGELDMTMDHELIQPEPTEYELIQGNNIGLFKIKPGSKFVSNRITSRPKSKYLSKPRIACQQITNMNSRKRLKWCYVPANKVLANSTNFIAVSEEFELNQSDYLYYLLGVLNSNLIELRFRITSPNNHVSNLEIGNLPIGKGLDNVGVEIAKLSKSMVYGADLDELEHLNSLVEKHFEI